MIKKFTISLFFLTLLISKLTFGSTSASFLISQNAFNNHDFNQVLYEYKTKDKEDYNYKDKEDYNYKDDYLDELISAVVTQDIILAKKISNLILLKNPNNQEAKFVSMVLALSNNSLGELELLRFDDKKNKNDLFEFIFYFEDKIKTNIDISNSFLEIVRSSYSKSEINYFQNYNFLLFYTSLSILINNENYEAILIKGQLLQIINDYFFAESTYLKIPKKSKFFLDAQKNIAFNYSHHNNFNDAENKIKLIVLKNNQDNELKKIFADFYRVEKKYDMAIDIYSELIDKNIKDVWYMYYLRGICHEQSDRWEKAELDFLKSLRIKKDSPNVLNYLAYGWIERDIKIEKSFLMLTDAYNANPDSYYILDSLSWAYFKKKNYSKAAELMEKVIDMVPGEAISLDHLGDIYYAMNRKREAIYFWRQAKDLAKPEDEFIEKIKKKLRENNAG